MDPAPTSSDEPTPQEGVTKEPGRALRILARATLFSAFVHTSPLLIALYVMPSPDPLDLDTEWFGEFEDLQAVGHGNLGREVEFTLPPKEETPEAPPTQEEPQEIPQEEEKPEEPEPKPEEKPDPPKPKVEKKDPPKLAAVDKKTPKPKPPEIKKDPPPTPEVKPRPDKKQDPPPKPEQVTTSSRSAESLPGLEYSGPSNLPMLKNYAPGNARMTALIRLDVLRDTPYHEPTKKLLAAVPDYRIILDGSSTDPVRSFDTIFTASANPMYLQETFLVVKHSLGKKALKAQLDARFDGAPEWSTYKGVQTRPIVPASSTYQDPRKVLLADDSTALVARPEWLKTLTADQASDASIRPDFEGDAPPKFTMLQSFEHIANAAPGDTMVLASFHGLRFMLPGIGTLPRTETLRVSITTPDNPHVTVDLQFKTNAQAKSFADQCPEMQRQLIKSIPGARLMRIDAYINRLSCKAEDAYVTVTGTYTQKEFLRALNLATPFLPKPPSLEDLPRPPERQPEPDLANVDMGTSDMGTPDLGTPSPGHMMESTPQDMDTRIDMATTPAKKETAPDMASSELKQMNAPDMTPAQPDGKEAPPTHVPDMSPALIGD